jgi:hypothetical protein
VCNLTLEKCNVTKRHRRPLRRKNFFFGGGGVSGEINRLMVFENRVVSRIFGCKKDEQTEGRWKLEGAS